ncbi:MAG: carboxypeptidase-like regulatory domain-containing protein [Bacteroidota bacterium]
MNRWLVVFLLLQCSAFLVAQDESVYEINGVITDQVDRKAVPFVNVHWNGTRRGTVTNNLGEFILKVDTLPIQLNISHVGYDGTSVSVNAPDEFVRIALKPSTLQSVTVTERRANKNKNILEKALKRARRHALKNHFGRAFYRQLSTNDSTYNELYEIFFDTRFNADGINDWAIEQGRYALLERTGGKPFIFNKNFTLINRIFPTMHPETDRYLSPVKSDGIYYYDIEMTSSFVDSDDREIAVIAYTPKPDATAGIPAMKGELYIDLKTYDILKVKGTFENDDLEVIELHGDGAFDSYVLNYEAAFKPNEKGDLLMDYIKVNQSCDVVYDKYPTRHLETNALLTFYEYYEPKGRKKRRLGGRLRFKRSDQERINRVDYDPVFWAENPIVKRTPIEEEVIAAFEADRQFGSIYLNNKNQVAFLPELDQDPVIQVMTERLARNVPIYEKVYLHVDKPYYARGETLWFKAYITDAIVHRPYNLSRAMYVELINPLGEEVAHKKLEIEGSGFAQGDFLIYPGYLSGTYLLRAYTDQMRYYDHDYFFEKEINIYTGLEPATPPAVERDIDVQFFPEGGNLVYNIPSQVAFYATDENGRPATISGAIYDDSDEKIIDFETRYDGRGSFVLRAETGRTYYARVSNGTFEKRVEIMTPLEKGYVITVSNKPGKNLIVRVLSHPSLNNSQVYLIGQTRRHIYYKSKGTLKRQLLTFEVPKRILPNGILHLTLMDSLHRPFCERLAFIDHEDHLDLSINPNKKKYNKRSNVELNFRLRDAFGDPIQAEMSVAVTDAGQIQLPKYSQNFKNYLLLTSDLKGQISNPELYFNPDLPGAHRLLDLVMLTNGWRRFTWQRALRKSVSQKVPRTGFDICGKLRPADFEKYGRTVLTLIPLGEQPGLYTATVNQRGEFCFANVNFRNTSRLTVQAIDDDGNYNEVSVELDETNNISSDHLALPVDTLDALTTNYLNFNEIKLQDQLYFEGTSISLNEVTVTAKAKEKTEGFRTFHTNANQVFSVDGKENTMVDVINQQVTGINLRTSGTVTQLTLTNTEFEPLILLDGLPMNIQPYSYSPGSFAQQDGTQGAPVFELASRSWGQSAVDALNAIPPEIVDRVEVLKGAAAAIYGTRGINGVIAIYTKKNPGRKDPVITQTYEGYYTAREFYVPKYEDKSRRDVRSTLFWQPSIMTDAQGRAKLSFPNSDLAKSFNVVVEGITAEGRPVSATLLHSWE